MRGTDGPSSSGEGGHRCRLRPADPGGLRPGSAHHWMQIVDGGEREAREAWERQLRTSAVGHPLTVGDLGGSWPRALTRTDHGRD